MKKIVLMVIIVIIITGFLALKTTQKNNPLANPFLNQQKTILPSENLIDYQDPAGFEFSYPDNLSIAKNETDNATYADLLISANDISGSLNLKIADSKFKSLDEWFKLNKGTIKEVKLGNLKAMEVKTADRLLLGALDQDIFFTIEMPLIEQDFWTKVYDKILANFSFVSPATTVQETSGDVSFESEEVVE